MLDSISIQYFQTQDENGASVYINAEDVTLKNIDVAISEVSRKKKHIFIVPRIGDSSLPLLQ